MKKDIKLKVEVKFNYCCLNTSSKHALEFKCYVWVWFDKINFRVSFTMQSIKKEFEQEIFLIGIFKLSSLQERTLWLLLYGRLPVTLTF